MTDATELLRDIIKVQADGSPMTPHLQAAIDEIKHHKGRAHSKDAEIATLQQALAERDEEIEHLKGTADAVSPSAVLRAGALGAVSGGPGFAEIKSDFIKPPARAADVPIGSTSWDASTNEPSK